MPNQLPSNPQDHYVAGDFITVEGRQFWVEQEGSGEPLLLLGGGPGASHLIFHPMFSALAYQYHIIYVDYYGRGFSERPASYQDITFAGDVADVAGIIQTLNLGAVNIYGFSYGGMIAQALALHYPALVRRVILANTLHSPEMWQKNHENINREIEHQYPEVWKEILNLRGQGIRSGRPQVQELYRIHSPLIRFYNPDNATKLLSDAVSRNPELYLTFAGDDIEFFIGGEVLRIPDFRPRLKEITSPLLVLAGRFDRALYPAYQLEFKQYAPQAEFVMLERSGSFAHIEEPETIFALIRKFLA